MTAANLVLKLKNKKYSLPFLLNVGYIEMLLTYIRKRGGNIEMLLDYVCQLFWFFFPKPKLLLSFEYFKYYAHPDPSKFYCSYCFVSFTFFFAEFKTDFGWPDPAWLFCCEYNDLWSIHISLSYPHSFIILKWNWVCLLNIFVPHRSIVRSLMNRASNIEYVPLNT